MMLYLPRYASPGKAGLCPPSPLAEGRASRAREVARESRYPISGRVLLPGMRFYEETLQAMRIGTPGAMTGGMASTTGVGTQLYGSGSGNPTILSACVAYWKLDEAQNSNRLDSTANANTMAPHGTTNPTSVAGKIANAAAFAAASSQYLEAASSASLQITADTTFAGWANFQAFPGTEKGIINKGAVFPGAFEWKLYMQTVPNFDVRDSNNANVSIAFPTPSGGWQINTWYFLVALVTFVGTTILTHTNNAGGGTVSSSGGHNPAAPGTTVVRMGAASGGNFADVTLDGWGIYSKLLSSSEQTALYNSGNGLDYPF